MNENPLPLALQETCPQPVPDSFRDLLRRVRLRDQAAAAELVRRYEPEIRCYVRLHLTDPRLRRLVESGDICQSVLANFFARAASGQFELDRPEQLLQLLLTMARNRLRTEVTRQQAECRDCRRVGAGPRRLEAVASAGPSPWQIVAERELIEKVRRHLSDEARYLAEQRALGREWADLAAELGASPEALRKKLFRAAARAVRQLGLEDAFLEGLFTP